MIAIIIILAVIAILALFKWLNYYLSTFGLLYYLLNNYDDEVTVEQMKEYAIKAFGRKNKLSERKLRQHYISGIIDDINKSTKLGIFEKTTISEAVIKQSKQLKKQNVEDILYEAATILKNKDTSNLKEMENENLKR